MRVVFGCLLPNYLRLDSHSTHSKIDAARSLIR